MKVTALIVCLALVAVQAAPVTEEPESVGLFDSLLSWWTETTGTDPQQKARDMIQTGRDMIEDGHAKIQLALSEFDVEVPDVEIPAGEEINRNIQAKIDEAKNLFDESMAAFRLQFENFDWDILDVIPNGEPEPEPEHEAVATTTPPETNKWSWW